MLPINRVITILPSSRLLIQLGVYSPVCLYIYFDSSEKGNT